MVDIVDITENVVYPTPTLEEVRDHLLLPTETHNGMISRLIVAACEKAEQVTGRSLTVHEYKVEVDSHDGTIYLLKSPIFAIDKVEYFDGTDWQRLEVDEYDEFGINEKYIGVSMAYQRVRITYTTAAYTNKTLIKLIMDLVEVWYDSKPDAENLEQLVVNRMSKFKIWQVE